MLLIFIFFSAWMFFEDNKANIVRGSEGVVDFSSLFDNAINQKDSFIPFQDSKVSIFWFLIMSVRSWSSGAQPAWGAHPS